MAQLMIRPAKRGEYEYETNECGPLAWWRRCHNPGRNKGSFSPGRGYTSYHEKEIPVCMTRHLHGCPFDGVDPENRMCRIPDPDWYAVATYAETLKGLKRIDFVFRVLLPSLITSVEHWRKIARVYEGDDPIDSVVAESSP